MKHFHTWIGALLLFAACKGPQTPVLPMPEFTGFNTEVTADAAVITVSHKGDYGIVEAGIYLGADKRIKADALDPGQFTVSVSGLEPSTTYTYKAFISSGLQEVTSQEQTFTTAAAPKVVATGNGAYTIWTENTSLQEILPKWDIDLADIKHLKVVGTLAKDDFPYIRNQMKELKSIDLRETALTVLPNQAFAFSGIESVELPDGLEEIGQSAFESCELLSGVFRFPKSLRVIGADAFAQCHNLEGIELPDGLERIRNYSFRYCDRLGGKLVLPESLLEIGELTHYQALDLAQHTAQAKVVQHTVYRVRALAHVFYKEDTRLVGAQSKRRSLQTAHHGQVAAAKQRLHITRAVQGMRRYLVVNRLA